MRWQVPGGCSSSTSSLGKRPPSLLSYNCPSRRRHDCLQVMLCTGGCSALSGNPQPASTTVCDHHRRHGLRLPQSSGPTTTIVVLVYDHRSRKTIWCQSSWMVTAAKLPQPHCSSDVTHNLGSLEKQGTVGHSGGNWSVPHLTRFQS